ncbi:hypothetical protein [Streptomyces sp. NPDC047043]|uniref:hypothetical protein n=1 Tax=Streptomyces sp. NPDC047043 TaxID=3154497 RepID=UPI0033F8631E
MSFGGPNPYQQPWPPNGGPYPPPSPPGAGSYVPPQPYGHPQPGPQTYGYPQPVPAPPPWGVVPAPQQTSFWDELRGLRGAEWPPLSVLLRGGRPRIHGCTWALLIFPCAWILTVPLLGGYALVRSARHRAHGLFPARGHRGIEDPEVKRVQRIRAWTAFVISLLILVVYGGFEGVSQAEGQYLTRLALTPPMLLVSAPLVVGLLFRWASPQTKARMRPRLHAAGRAALWYVGAVTAVPLFVILLGLAEPAVGKQAAPWAALAMFVPMIWLVVFVLFASAPAVRSGFNTAPIHAALPALLTGVLVWEFAVVGVATGGLPPGPPLVRICALLGGPASVTAVAWWEIHRLRTLHGVSLRG